MIFRSVLARLDVTLDWVGVGMFPAALPPPPPITCCPAVVDGGGMVSGLVGGLVMPTSPPRASPPRPASPACDRCCSLGDPASSTGRGEFLLALLGGILSGSTSGLSLTGSTIAVRPDGPFHPGRLDVKADTAGSVVWPPVGG